MQQFLFHGTRYLDKIIAENRLRVAPYGDKHVSLTQDEWVARYFASLERDDTNSKPYVIKLNTARLILGGYKLKPFVSGTATGNEHEIACDADILNLSHYIDEILPIHYLVTSLKRAA